MSGHTSARCSLSLVRCAVVAVAVAVPIMALAAVAADRRDTHDTPHGPRRAARCTRFVVWSPHPVWVKASASPYMYVYRSARCPYFVLSIAFRGSPIQQTGWVGLGWVDRRLILDPIEFPPAVAYR